MVVSWPAVSSLGSWAAAGLPRFGAGRRGLHWHDSLRPTVHVAIPRWTVVSVVGSRIGTSYYGSPTNGLLTPAATRPLTIRGQRAGDREIELP